jgi:hypothetical protein
MFGSYITIVPNQHTAAFYEGGKVNKFRIVALGPQFDVYLNDQLLVSVEDEYFQKGSIGFQVRKGGRVKIDNIKVWEAVDGRK